ncbi:MAG TPA: EVE domain-containing protein [Burkholderiales bacterium]|jgi:predicted RNA-binding protein with PUA-like domain|nr:EVE domain-containing protein [Burkholderiales bacterium]
MRYWLMKSEPDVFSVDDLADRPNRTEPWTGVRNYQARNFMRDEMKVGDLAFFYHSSCPQPGIVGIVRIARLAYPDPTQFDPASEYYDPKATRHSPRWYNVDVTLVEKTRLISLQELRSHRALRSMQVLRRGNRLSITPVSEREWDLVQGLVRRRAQGFSEHSPEIKR